MTDTKATERKRVLIAWSGGLDSTYLVQKRLEEGWGVDALPITLLNNEAKNHREFAARTKMVESHFYQYDFRLLKSPLFEFEYGSYVTFTQPPVWLMGLLSALGPQHTEVSLGYVMNDDAIAYLDELQAAWKALGALAYAPGEILPNLTFPLKKFKKTEIWNGLRPELRKHVTWCELSYNDRPCDRCTPCKKMIDLGFQRLRGDIDAEQAVMVDEAAEAPYLPRRLFVPHSGGRKKPLRNPAWGGK